MNELLDPQPFVAEQPLLLVKPVDPNSDEEFFDCLDDYKDVEMLKNNFQPVQPVAGIRRTASFHEFNRIEEASSEEEADQQAVANNSRGRRQALKEN